MADAPNEALAAFVNIVMQQYAGKDWDRTNFRAMDCTRTRYGFGSDPFISNHKSDMQTLLADGGSIMIAIGHSRTSRSYGLLMYARRCYNAEATTSKSYRS